MRLKYRAPTEVERKELEREVATLREKLLPLGLSVDISCRYHQMACTVDSSFGFVPEAECPIHDTYPTQGDNHD